MTEEQIIKALEEFHHRILKTNLSYHIWESEMMAVVNALDLIKRLKAENDDLFYKLQGVMWFVDKWLDGDELKQDEVSRASTMRFKTLQIAEKQEAEIEELQKRIVFWRADLNYQPEKVKAEAIQEFADRLKDDICNIRPDSVFEYDEIESVIDNLVKEMTEQRKEDEKNG